MSAEGALRVERRVFAGVGAFLVPWAVLYAATSDDEAGAVLLFVSAAALLAVAGYLTMAARGVAPRASDDPDAAPTDAHHEAPVPSLWPFLIGGGATVLGFGLAFTSWVAVPAGLVLGIGVIGYVRESSWD